jgi:titin
VKAIVLIPDIILINTVDRSVKKRAGTTAYLEAAVTGRPAPKVSWEKDGQAIKETKKMSVSSSGLETCVTIQEVNASDAGAYKVTAENAGGSKTETIKLVILDKPGNVEDLTVDEVTESSVSLVWKPPTHTGGCDISSYIVEYRDEESGVWLETPSHAVRPKIVVRSLDIGKSYYFRVSAENKFGFSDSVSTDAVLVKYPFNVPGVPGTPQVTSAGFDHIGLQWTPPIEDGGSPVTAYFVEGKDQNSIQWHRMNSVGISSNSYRVQIAESGLAYEFRVTAQNAAGRGKASKASEAAVAIDQVTPPQDLEILDYTSTSVELIWLPPDYDDGAGITGYIVEKKDTFDGRWVRCNYSNCLDCEFLVTELESGHSYHFRVLATNSVGSTSLPSAETPEVTCLNEASPPRFDLSDKTKDTIIAKAGEVITIVARIFGKPLPTVTWKQDGAVLQKSSHVDFITSSSEAGIVINECTRDDSGTYEVTLQNIAGSRTIALNVIVLDKPGQPVGPIVVSDMTSEKCTLKWLPPRNDGGAEISHYIVSKRETSRAIWSIVSDDVKLETIKVTKLLKGNEYIFRVKAVNMYGESAPLDSVELRAQDSYTVAGQPGALQISSVTKNSAVLTWESPASDGDNIITNYQIEKREITSMKWTRAVRRQVTELYQKVTGLKEGSSYEFRVAAENDAGVGAYSEEAGPVLCKDPLYPPGPVRTPKVADVTKSSISLSWLAPVFDGGSEITGYQVETCVKDADEWVVAASGIQATSYTIRSLEEKQQYQLRVAAVNAIGVGELIHIPGLIEGIDILEEPVIGSDSDLRKNIKVKAGKKLQIVAYISGKPFPTVMWTKEDDSNLMKHAEIEYTDTSTILTIPSTKREDFGKYTLTLENRIGSTSASCNVKVLDTPGCCSNLKVKDVKKDCALITWDEPSNDGGAMVTQYIVELKETSKKSWTTITTTCQRTI